MASTDRKHGFGRGIFSKRDKAPPVPEKDLLPHPSAPYASSSFTRSTTSLASSSIASSFIGHITPNTSRTGTPSPSLAPNSSAASVFRRAMAKIPALAKRPSFSSTNSTEGQPLDDGDEGISLPWNITHDLHVEPKEDGLVGLPSSWSSALSKAGFSENEIHAMYTRGKLPSGSASPATPQGASPSFSKPASPSIRQSPNPSRTAPFTPLSQSNFAYAPSEHGYSATEHAASSIREDTVSDMPPRLSTSSATKPNARLSIITTSTVHANPTFPSLATPTSNPSAYGRRASVAVLSPPVPESGAESVTHEPNQVDEHDEDDEDNEDEDSEETEDHMPVIRATLTPPRLSLPAGDTEEDDWTQSLLSSLGSSSYDERSSTRPTASSSASKDDYDHRRDTIVAFKPQPTMTPPEPSLTPNLHDPHLRDSLSPHSTTSSARSSSSSLTSTSSVQAATSFDTVFASSHRISVAGRAHAIVIPTPSRSRLESPVTQASPSRDTLHSDFSPLPTPVEHPQTSALPPFHSSNEPFLRPRVTPSPEASGPLSRRGTPSSETSSGTTSRSPPSPLTSQSKGSDVDISESPLSSPNAAYAAYDAYTDFGVQPPSKAEAVSYPVSLRPTSRISPVPSNSSTASPTVSVSTPPLQVKPTSSRLGSSLQSLPNAEQTRFSVPPHFRPLERYLLPDHPHTRFSDMTQVAEGQFGPVYAARASVPNPRISSPLTTSMGNLVAVKTIQVEDEGSPKVQALAAELNIMSGVHHEHVLATAGLYVSGNTLWVEMELMERSLADLLPMIEEGLNISEAAIARFASDILLGLSYLESLHIAHRDVRSDNLLISRTGVIKLADFSHAVITTPGVPCMSMVPVPPYWMAPEMRMGRPYNPHLIDIWSTGATIWEVIEGSPPFFEVEDASQFGERWPNLTRASEYSVPLHHFLRLCSESDDWRPVSDELLTTPFIRSACSRSEIIALLTEVRSLEDSLAS